MYGIYYKEGIYALIDNDIKNDICLYHYNFKDNVVLYGGRINIRFKSEESAYLYVDGIPIIKIDENKIQDGLSLSAIVSHLNAIESNGVDSFIEHYKKSIIFLYGELKEINQKTESLISSLQDETKIDSLLSELKTIRKLLISVLAIIFSLYSYMTAGLENEKVLGVYQSIMDSLSLYE